ncbi:hypothetical protein HD806DRAFT_474158 [Xylariaceae sp. AK1471]|nr:hypothetical protein HD806DRAFT_474158 [Xylariaceae sp. AK1471]
MFYSKSFNNGYVMWTNLAFYLTLNKNVCFTLLDYTCRSIHARKLIRLVEINRLDRRMCCYTFCLFYRCRTEMQENHDNCSACSGLSGIRIKMLTNKQLNRQDQPPVSYTGNRNLKSGGGPNELLCCERLVGDRICDHVWQCTLRLLPPSRFWDKPPRKQNWGIGDLMYLQLTHCA